MSGGGKIEFIVLNNFKSFKGENKVGPFLDFSAIIGPNGGGKSNIMDAIAFVFGVRSLDLRAANLKELIYRQEGETGNANTREAHVELQLHSNSQLVSFKRTISPTGASEYFIDNEKYGSEEYQGVLRATNINVKAKNFVIFQGQIDSLAMKSGKDLTVLFEKISMSVEFKEEYESARSLMEEQQEDLKNYNKREKYLKMEKKQLKDQKNNFLKYEKEIQVVRKLQTEFHIVQYLILHNEIHRRKEQLLVKNEQFLLATQEKDATLQQLKRNTVDVDSLEQQAVHTSAELSSKKHKLMMWRPELSKVNETLRQFESRINNKTSSFEEMKHKLDLLRLEEIKLKEEANIYEKELQLKMSQQTQQISIELEPSKKEKYLKLKAASSLQSYSTNKELDRLYRDLAAKKVYFSHVSQEFTRKEEEVLCLNTEITHLKSSITQKEQEGSSFTDSAHGKQTHLEKLVKQQESSKKEETQLIEELRLLEGKLRDAEISSNRKSAQDREKKFLDELKRQLKGLKGKLGDLVGPVQNKYSTAVSACLKGISEYLIVDTSETAEYLSQKLKEQFLQKTLIVLQNTPEMRSNEALRHAVSQYGCLFSDVLSYDKSFGLEKVVNALVGGTVLAEGLTSAELLRGVPGIKQIITLDGITIKKNMISSLGKQQSGRNTVKLQELKNDIDNRKEHLRKLRTQWDDRLLIENTKQEIERLEVCAGTAQFELRALQEQLKNSESFKRDNESSLCTLQEKRVLAERQLSQLKQAASVLDSELKRVEDNVFAQFCGDLGINNVRELDGTSYADNNKLQEEMNSLRQGIARVNMKIERLDLAQNEGLLQRIVNSLEKDYVELKSLQHKAGELQNNIEGLKQTQNTLEAQAASLQTSLNTLQSAKLAIEHSLESCTKAVHSLEKAHSQEERELEHLYQQELQRIEEAIVKNIELPLLNYPENPAFDLSAVDKKYTELAIEGLEAESDCLVSAINEHAGNIEHLVSTTNYSFNQEKLNLLEGKLIETQQLCQTAGEKCDAAKRRFESVKEQRRTLFMRTFEQIAGNIDKIYKGMTKSAKNLYQGGNALLYMENTEEPFNGGVVFSPTPPGKRCMYEMDQLSGGEKSMAALSLLFAIHSAVPAPFYVLDEVDAFLDCENGQLLLAYLQELTERSSQVIVITHKEDFFSNADSLIGTTLIPQEMSSRTFSVDLRKFGPRQLASV